MKSEPAPKFMKDALPYDEKTKNEKPWYEKAGIKDAPHQYRKLRLFLFRALKTVQMSLFQIS